jgi:uncharacterized membrane protein YoaK (UPF0700 family)
MPPAPSTAIHVGADASHYPATLSRSERWLPTLLSVIAGMVDLIGFLSLGIFTAHITGNIVIVGALIARHNQINPAQILAIPFFILAVAATWLVAKTSGLRGNGLKRLLLLIQFVLITCLLIFSVITRPSADPHGPMATVAAMVAVTAMGCQFAFLRLTLPVAPSTAVMTGNLTSAVLAIVDLSSRSQPLMESDSRRLTGSLHLLIGFFAGCVLAAAAVMFLGDWAWSLPAGLAAVAAIWQ